MAVLALGDLFGKLGRIWMNRSFQPLMMMAEQVGGDVLGKQGSMSIHPLIMPGKAISARRLHGSRDLKTHVLQAVRGRCNVHMPSERVAASEAIAVLERREQQGITIDSHSVIQVLKQCSMQKDLTTTRRVNDWIVQSGMDKDRYVANTLLNAYVRCGRLHDARRVFDGLQKKDKFTWTIMIRGYAKNDYPEDALGVFNQMRQGGVQPDELLCMSILNACASSVALKCGPC